MTLVIVLLAPLARVVVMRISCVTERALVVEDLVSSEEECPAVDVLESDPEEVLTTVAPSGLVELPELAELSRDEWLVVRGGVEEPEVEEPEVELKHEDVALEEELEGDGKR